MSCFSSFPAIASAIWLARGKPRETPSLKGETIRLIRARPNCSVMRFWSFGEALGDVRNASRKTEIGSFHRKIIAF